MFELYPRSGMGRTNANEKHVTLTKAGDLCFNTMATKEIVKDSQFAVLYFDKATKTIGVKFYTTPQENGYKLVRNHKLAYLNARRFCRYYGIEHETSRRLSIQWNTEECLWVLGKKEGEKHE